MNATSPYLNQPVRSTREAEIDRLAAELKDCERFLKTDGNLESVRLLLEMALKCAQAHYDNLPTEERSMEAQCSAERLKTYLWEFMDSYERARAEYADYLTWLEEQQQIAGMR